MGLITYYGSAGASASRTAYYSRRPSHECTATGTATSQSTKSQSDADAIAKSIAQAVANDAAETAANLSVQNVNLATNNSKIIPLSSTLLTNYITQDSYDTNLWNLVKSYPIPVDNTLIIEEGQTLIINSGVILTINSGSNIYIAPCESSDSSPGLPALGGTLSNNGTISISSGGTLFNNATVNNGGTINSFDISGNEFGIIVNGGRFENLEISDETLRIPTGAVNFNNNGSVNGAFNITNGIRDYKQASFNITNGSTQIGSVTFDITNGGTFDCYGPIINEYSGITPDTESKFNFTGVSFNTNSPIYNYGSCKMKFTLSNTSSSTDSFSTSSSINNIGNFTIANSTSNSSPISFNTINNGSFTLSNFPNDGVGIFTITNGGNCSCNGIIINGYSGTTPNSASTFSFTGSSFTTNSSIYNYQSDTMTFTLSEITQNQNSFTQNTQNSSINNIGNFTIANSRDNLSNTSFNTINNGSFTLSNFPDDGVGIFTITNGGNCSCNNGIITNGYSGTTPDSASTFNFTGISFTTNSPIYNYQSDTMTFTLSEITQNQNSFSQNSSINNIGTITITNNNTNNSSFIIFNTINNGSFTLSNFPDDGVGTFNITNGGYCTGIGVITNGYSGTTTDSASTFNFTGISFTNNSPIYNFQSDQMTFILAESFSTSSSINNFGTINIDGNLNLSSSTSEINNGYITDLSGLSGNFIVTNGGSCNSYATIKNGFEYTPLSLESTFNFTGTSFTNNSTITNYSDYDTMTFNCDLINDGTITNNGTITATSFSGSPANPNNVTT